MEQTITKLTESGRLVIPATMRKALKLSVGEEIVIILKGQELIVLSRAEAVRRSKELVRRKVKKGRSLVKELLAERKEESARE
jgi:AbrB family looped-hinge helix DNA binding protein